MQRFNHLLQIHQMDDRYRHNEAGEDHEFVKVIIIILSFFIENVLIGQGKHGQRQRPLCARCWSEVT